MTDKESRGMRVSPFAVWVDGDEHLYLSDVRYFHYRRLPDVGDPMGNLRENMLLPKDEWHWLEGQPPGNLVWVVLTGGDGDGADRIALNLIWRPPEPSAG